MKTGLFQFIMTMVSGMTLLISLGLISAHFNYRHYAIAQQCDRSLWRHIFQPKRLTVIDICKTVSGTIVDQRLQKTQETGEGDGDIHMRVKLDPQFMNLITPGNYEEEGQGYLVVEPICQTTPTKPAVVPYCKNFHQNINLPPDGTHVAITGSYVLDEEHHRWAEIHPVTSIVPSPAENIRSSAENITSSSTPPSPPSTSELDKGNNNSNNNNNTMIGIIP
jgi:hypothetical protein